MPYSLNSARRYSPLEQRAFGLLPQGKDQADALTSTMIAAKLYGRRPNANQRTMSVLRSLKAKAIRYREPFRIKQTARRGPHPVSWWVESK